MHAGTGLHSEAARLLATELTNARFEGPSALSLGTELTVQGNQDVVAYGLGGVVGVLLLRLDASLQLRTGVNRRSFAAGGRELRPYAGLGVYTRR